MTSASDRRCYALSGQRVLRSLGTNRSRAQSSEAAGTRPDLVILDLGLPDIDGLDVCRHIHELDSSIEIVMLTARDEELDIVVGLDAGAIDYITKPFKLAELLARIRAQFRRSATQPLSRTTFDDLTIDFLAPTRLDRAVRGGAPRQGVRSAGPPPC